MGGEPSSIVILTGAGVSAESGVETFRDKGGIWSKVRLEDVATPEAFTRDPETVHEFYNARRHALDAVEPNPAHRALARLQSDHAGKVTLVTQNIDDLHERGGSPDVLHMHGRLREAMCAHCEAVVPWRGDLSSQAICPACGRAGGLRPNVVWFGEIPHHMDEILAAIARADLFVSIGTSGAVYPAAGFVMEARRHGAQTLELNLEPSEGSALFHESRQGLASVLVPHFVEEMLQRR